MVQTKDLLLIGGGLLAFMALRGSSPVGEERGIGFGAAPAGAGIDLSGIFRGLDILGTNQERLSGDQEAQTSFFGNLFGGLESSNVLLNDRLSAIENLPAPTIDIGGILAQIMGTLSPAIGGLGLVAPLLDDDPFADFGPETDIGNPLAVASASSSVDAFREAGGTINVQPELQARFDALEDASAPSESSNGVLPLADLFSGFDLGNIIPKFDPNFDFGIVLSGFDIPDIGEIIPAPSLNFDFALDELVGTFNIPNLPESFTLPPIDFDQFNFDGFNFDDFDGFEIPQIEFNTPQFDSPFDFSLPDLPDIGLKTALIGGGAGYLGMKFLPKIGSTVLTGGANLVPKVLRVVGRRLFTPFILPIPDPNFILDKFGLGQSSSRTEA